MKNMPGDPVVEDQIDNSVHEEGAPFYTEPEVAPTVPRRHVVGLLVRLLLFLVLINLLGVIWWNRDIIKDWVRLHGYTPASNISQLAQDTTMTSYAQRLFYVNYPDVEQRDTFNKHC